MATFGILGGGNMGTAMAQVAAVNGHTVLLWTIEPDTIADLRENQRNSAYIGDVPLSPHIQATMDLAEACHAADVVVVCVPSQAVRSVMRETTTLLREGQVVLNTAKGLEEESHLRMSVVMAEELPQTLLPTIATMGGPAIAREFALGLPTAVAVAAGELAVAERVRELLENDYFKVEAGTDMLGVELGATLKNVYAIPLGMSDGINLGANTKAIIGTIGMAELLRIGCALGGRNETLQGLAGLGDLLTTGYSPLSRNRTLGERLGANSGWQEYLDTHTVEGVPAIHTVRELIEPLQLETPLLEMMYEILFQGATPDERLRRFLANYAFRQSD
jgi:glycerol-3-phosphate dehydrogenase (NAD(P)+)